MYVCIYALSSRTTDREVPPTLLPPSSSSSSVFAVLCARCPPSTTSRGYPLGTSRYLVHVYTARRASLARLSLYHLCVCVWTFAIFIIFLENNKKGEKNKKNWSEVIFKKYIFRLWELDEYNIYALYTSRITLLRKKALREFFLARIPLKQGLPTHAARENRVNALAR